MTDDSTLFIYIYAFHTYSGCNNAILQGIWVGMIGGTMVQTLILSFITLRCDWNEEVWFSSVTLNRLSNRFAKYDLRILV